MHPTLFILRFRLRSFRRWVGAHGFEILLLGPVIVGGALWVFDRQLSQLREPLARWLSQGSDHPSPGTASLVLALSLVAFALPGTFRELYDHRRASGYLDALPVPAPARFHASLAAELARSLPAVTVLLLAAGALAGQLLPPFPALAPRVLKLLAAVLALALARFVAVLVLAHWRASAFAPSRWLAIGGALFLALGAPHPAFRLLLLPCLAPAAQLETVVFQALGLPHREGPPWAEAWQLAATALGLYLLARLLYVAWHRRDLETASRLSRRRQRWTPGLYEQLLWRVKVPARPLAAQIGRDLTLVLRRFSPAVTTSAGLALVLDGVVLTLLFEAGLPSLWRQRLAVSGLTLSVLAIVALVPFLLKHQLPRFWIEKSTGVDLEQIWKAKLWTAALLASAPFAAGTAILLAAPDFDAAARATAILQFAAAAWIVTSVVSLAIFEIAAQPLLGLVFGALLGLAIAALFIFYPRAWWLWAVLYVWVAGQIAGRATRRVHLVEAEA